MTCSPVDSPSPQEQLDSVVAAVLRLVSKNIADPSAKEIAIERWPGDFIGKSRISEVVKMFAKICPALTSEHKRLVISLSGSYYRLKAEDPDGQERSLRALAREGNLPEDCLNLCLPTGGGSQEHKKAFGLLIQVPGGPSQLFEKALELQRARTQGQVESHAKRLRLALDGHVYSSNVLLALFRAMQKVEAEGTTTLKAVLVAMDRSSQEQIDHGPDVLG